jgi:ABC-type glycerol-3-phosphate transport system substrate-binding protein
MQRLRIVGIILVLALLCIAVPVFAAEGMAFKGQQITGLFFKGSDTDYMMSTLAPRLKKETGIDLVIDEIAYEDVRAKQLADVAGAKRYDVINPCTEWSYEYRQFAAPLGSYIGKGGYPEISQSDVIPFVWKEFNPGANVCWLPYQPDTRLFLYRADLLGGAGIAVPKTWDNLLSAAQKLTKGGQYGFVFPAQRGWNLMLAWVPVLFSAGGELFVDNKPVFNSQAGVDALNLLIKLKKFGPPDIDNYGEYEVNQTVKSGKIAMCVSASAITSEIEAPDVPTKGKFKSALFPLQTAGTTRKFTAGLGGWAMGVSSYSKHKDAAAYAVMWLTSKDIVTDMEIHGRQHAARLSMATNPELLAVNPHVTGIVNVLKGATLFFKGPEGASLGELLNVRVAQAISGEMAPKAALDAAVEDINKALAK